MTDHHRGSALNQYYRALASFAALVAAALMLAAFAPSAHAVRGHFCPPYPAGEVRLHAYGSPSNTDRCAGAYHSNFIAIDARNIATPVMKCAVLKPNSNGSGGNVGGLAANCAPAMDVAVQYPGGLGGYPTIINQGANFHSGFQGRHEYY